MSGQCLKVYAGADCNLFSGSITTKSEEMKKLFRTYAYNLLIQSTLSVIEPPRGKTNNVVSEQVGHKAVCKSTEKKLEASNFGFK